MHYPTGVVSRRMQPVLPKEKPSKLDTHRYYKQRYHDRACDGLLLDLSVRVSQKSSFSDFFSQEPYGRPLSNMLCNFHLSLNRRARADTEGKLGEHG